MRNNHSNFESRTEKDIYEAPNPGTQNSSRYDLWQRLAREREQSQVGPETVRDLIPRPPFDNHLRIVEKPLPVVVLRRNRNPSLDAENDHLEKQLRGYRNDGAIVEKPLPVVLRRNRNGNPSLDAENDHLEKQLRGYRNDGAYENSDIEKILKTATPVLTEHEREIFSDLQKIENRIRQ